MMKKNSYATIDKIALNKEFIKHKLTQFPKKPSMEELEVLNELDSDLLFDLFIELAYLDGHIAGLVSTYLSGKLIDYGLLNADYEFNEIRSKLKIKTKSLDEIDHYKQRLDLMVQMLKKLEIIA